ncbi:MAG: permease [Candidatus Latescibacteria bacterium]|nr:permease [Candidatus Latescibacterota bacterium]
MSLLYEILDVFYGLNVAIEALFHGTYTGKVIANTWFLFRGLWYYVIFGATAAVLVTRLMSHRRVRDFLARKGSAPIFFAAVIGILSPMCTFAAIPLAGGLMAIGLPVPPLMAFLIASPLMNPSLFIVTWGVMGPEMAIARTLSALLMALAGGWITEWALLRGYTHFTDPVRSGFSAGGTHPVCMMNNPQNSAKDNVFNYLKLSAKMTLFISKYFVLALFLAGAVQTFISPEWIGRLLGGKGFKSVLLGGLLGIPLYVCGGGTVALIGVLVNMGMGQGAALAFFITGPATKISTLVSLNAVLRKKVALLYLAVTLTGGLIFGYGYSKIAPELTLNEKYYGKVESKEDAVLYRPGIGSSAQDY